MGSNDKQWFRAQAIGSVERPDGINEGGVEQDTPAVIRVRPEWQAHLTGLDGFSHLVVVAWMDQAKRRRPSQALIRPQGREEFPEVGSFATRSPSRPNKIGLCYPRLERIEGTALHVRGLDFWDGTPIVDIKGYFPRDETKPGATVPSWLSDLWNAFDMEKATEEAIPAALAEVETERGRVVFRRSRLADAPAALAYINALSRERTYILMQGEQLTLTDEIAYFQGLFQKREAGDAVHTLAMAGEEVVGIANCERGPRVFAHTAGLGISIAREWRGLGLGRRLMELLIAETARTMPGIEMMQLECFSANEAAIVLYESVGFVECGRIPGKIRYQGKLVDEVIMTRPV